MGMRIAARFTAVSKASVRIGAGITGGEFLGNLLRGKYATEYCSLGVGRAISIALY